MPELVIVTIVLALVLAGVVSVATAARRAKKPKCSCADFAGDDPYCAIKEHRNAAKVYERIEKQSGSIPVRNRTR